MTAPRRGVLTAALLLVLLGAPLRAFAALTVAPVTLEFRNGQRAITTNVSNPGDRPMQVQVRVFQWTSDPSRPAEGEVHTPTRDVAFSPAMFTLKPGERQVVRLLLKTPAPAGREAAYRVVIDEIPNTTLPGVQMPLRMVLPLFAAGPGATPGRLQWSARRDGRETVITAQNLGGRRVKLFDVAAAAGGAPRPVQSGLAGYVLAGQARTWRIPAQGREVALTARTETDRIAVTLPVSGS